MTFRRTIYYRVNGEAKNDAVKSITSAIRESRQRLFVYTRSVKGAIITSEVPRHQFETVLGGSTAPYARDHPSLSNRQIERNQKMEQQKEKKNQETGNCIRLKIEEKKKRRTTTAFSKIYFCFTERYPRVRSERILLKRDISLNRVNSINRMRPERTHTFRDTRGSLRVSSFSFFFAGVSFRWKEGKKVREKKRERVV